MASPRTEIQTPDTPTLTRHIEFEASIFSAFDTNLSSPLSLNLPARDAKHIHEKRRSRQDSKVSHRSSLHRSSSLVFRTLPPLRRIPSLQVPSLTDITNPHTLSTPRRSLHQISETEPATYKLKLPLTLVHPNSPYVPWDAPVRQKILCPGPPPKVEVEVQQDEGEPLDTPDDKSNTKPGEKKPIKHIWMVLKSAPKNIKTKCQQLLLPRGKGSAPSSLEPSDANHEDDWHPDGSEAQIIASHLEATGALGSPGSPTASFYSTDTNTLAIWLAERQRKFLDKDCDSARIMSIEDYERTGSWVKPSEHPFSSRSSYCFSIADGDNVSSVIILGSEHDLPSPMTPEYSAPSSFARTPSSPSHRSAFGPKRVGGEEDRLSRIVHRTSLRSYLAERSLQSVPSTQKLVL